MTAIFFKNFTKFNPNCERYNRLVMVVLQRASNVYGYCEQCVFVFVSFASLGLGTAGLDYKTDCK